MEQKKYKNENSFKLLDGNKKISIQDSDIEKTEKIILIFHKVIEVHLKILDKIMKIHLLKYLCFKINMKMKINKILNYIKN